LLKRWSKKGTLSFSIGKINPPPLYLQNKFAGQIQNIEKIKEKIKEQIRASENLFRVLLQRAFNGGISYINFLYKSYTSYKRSTVIKSRVVRISSASFYSLSLCA
jgi:hypothetical protein